MDFLIIDSRSAYNGILGRQKEDRNKIDEAEEIRMSKRVASVKGIKRPCMNVTSVR